MALNSNRGPNANLFYGVTRDSIILEVQPKKSKLLNTFTPSNSVA